MKKNEKLFAWVTNFGILIFFLMLLYLFYEGISGVNYYAPRYYEVLSNYNEVLMRIDKLETESKKRLDIIPKDSFFKRLRLHVNSLKLYKRFWKSS